MSIVVNWIKEPTTYITADELNNLIDELERGPLKRVPFYTTKRIEAAYKTYCVGTNKTDVCIRVVYNINKIKSFTFSCIDTGHFRKGQAITGSQAYDFVESVFKEDYPKTTLFKAFSSKNNINDYNDIKGCVPKQISMVIDAATHSQINHCYKADVSSAYPYEGTKSLPTLKDSIRLKGIHLPNENYPFAFYVKSHHLAVYNEIDTHKWKDFQKYYTLYSKMFIEVPEDQEETILCKKSDYSLKNTFSKIYNLKIKGNKIAKLGMNAAIGYFQKNTNPKLSHLSAVIIARCCQRMILTAKELNDEGNLVLFIATDSIIWKGKESTIATNSKYLGSFTYEVKNSLFYALGPKAYQMLDRATNKTITKYAGMVNGEEKDNIKFGELPTLKGHESYIIGKDGRVTKFEGLQNEKK